MSSNFTELFSNSCSELWLKFVHHQASIFHDTVLKLEGDHLNFTEVGVIVLDLKEKFENRLQEGYVPLLLKNDLKFLINDGQITENYFMGHVRNFYRNVIDYLNKYCKQYLDFSDFKWTQLNNKFIKWNEVESSITYYMENVNTNLKENELFDEITFVSKYVAENLDRWVRDNVKTDKRWVEMFKHFTENGKPLENCKLLVGYILSVPGTNAPTERVFSLMNLIWTSEKTGLAVDTLGALLELKFNMGTCAEFAEILTEERELLRQVHGIEKYDFKQKSNVNLNS